MSTERQRIERVSSRRVRLTPAPGTGAEPERDATDAVTDDERTATASGPNDDRMRREVPPHY